MKLRVYCPAKVNLFLAVGPRDLRGYHPLRTVFQAIGLFDYLDVAFESGKEWSGLDIVGTDLPDDNTVSKTLRLSREIFAVSPSSIRLEKHIPMQSGLGGGSSDAAGLLRALNYVRGVSKAELEGVASAVGADVAFFLTGGRARGTGYGEVIEPVPDGPEEWLVIARPPIGCSTPAMYAKLDEEARNWRDWPLDQGFYNDFERVAPDECLDLIRRLRELGARDACLAGSGSSVFGLFDSEDAARAAGERLRQPDREVWVVKSLTRAESLRIDGVD